MRSPAIVAVVCLLAAGCDIQVGGDRGFSVDVSQGRASDEWTRTYTVSPGGRLEIVNVNGQIDARAADGAQVEVQAERQARASSDEAAAELLGQIEMREDAAPDRVRIEAQADTSMFGRRGFTINYRVRVPAGLTVVLQTQNGGIRLENVDGDITATTTNGGINGTGVSGRLTAEVVNGGVQMELASVRGEVDISTTNGGVRLDLEPGIRATLDTSCVNGGISVDDSLGLVVSERSRRQVTGTLNGGGPRIQAATVNGGIRIRPRGAGPDGS